MGGEGKAVEEVTRGRRRRKKAAGRGGGGGCSRWWRWSIRLLYQGTTEIDFTMWNDVLTAVKKYKNAELDAKLTKLRMLAPMLGMHEYFHPY
ncbi:hypothetical protein KSS87_001251 [Heliosperma pusillum]|nr:hypothetical protein KSS87_001251 [Heliosperma pusillum]